MNMDWRNAKPEYRHPRRTEAPRAVVVHSTGSTDAAKVERYYTTSDSGVCPHFLVLPDGVVQFVEVEHVAYHVGLSKEDRALYAAGRERWTSWRDGGLPAPYTGYDEWLARWPGKESPLELPTADHPNGRSVGIEMLSEGGLCTDRQYELLSDLLLTVADELQLPLTRDNLYGHYDANPLHRANSRGGTDPGPYFDWARVFKSLE